MDKFRRYSPSSRYSNKTQYAITHRHTYAQKHTANTMSWPHRISRHHSVRCEFAFVFVAWMMLLALFGTQCISVCVSVSVWVSARVELSEIRALMLCSPHFHYGNEIDWEILSRNQRYQGATAYPRTPTSSQPTCTRIYTFASEGTSCRAYMHDGGISPRETVKLEQAHAHRIRAAQASARTDDSAVVVYHLSDRKWSQKEWEWHSSLGKSNRIIISRLHICRFKAFNALIHSNTLRSLCQLFA